MRANAARRSPRNCAAASGSIWPASDPPATTAASALIEASRADGIRLICNNEEERYSGIRHCTTWPEQSLHAMLTMLDGAGIDPGQIHAFVASWDYVTLAATLLRSIVEELPASRVFLQPQNFAPMNARHIARAFRSPRRLGRQLGLGHAMPIIGMRHHDNHAYFSYAVSPFAGSDEPVMVSVLDGIGDDGAISLYLARGANVTLVHRNRDIFNSLGGFYSMISSTQGGWTILSSEGRYMGSAAWGDGERLTNRVLPPAARAVPLRPTTARCGSTARWRTGRAACRRSPTPRRCRTSSVRRFRSMPCGIPMR